MVACKSLYHTLTNADGRDGSSEGHAGPHPCMAFFYVVLGPIDALQQLHLGG